MFSNWREGEPNDQDGKEDCAIYLVSEEGLWNDLPCCLYRDVLCEVVLPRGNF